MLPWSVIPSAGWPSPTALATSSSRRAAPSSMENSVWTWRWVNDSAIGDPAELHRCDSGDVTSPLDGRGQLLGRLHRHQVADAGELDVLGAGHQARQSHPL